MFSLMKTKTSKLKSIIIKSSSFDTLKDYKIIRNSFSENNGTVTEN